MKVWLFYIDVLVVHHVSTPYNNTSRLTFELNKRTLVDVVNSMEFHTFFSILNAARALPVLFFTPASLDPPCLPIYYIAQSVKDASSSSSFASSVSGSSVHALICSGSWCFVCRVSVLLALKDAQS